MGRETLDLGRSKPLQCEGGQVGRPGPGRVKLWTCGQEEAEPRLGTLANEQAQQLQHGGVDPVQVFHDHEHRLPLRFGV